MSPVAEEVVQCGRGPGGDHTTYAPNVARLCVVVPGLGAAATVPYVLPLGQWAWPIAGLIGLLTLWRAYRVAVVLHREMLEVRNPWRTYRIPRAEITRLRAPTILSARSFYMAFTNDAGLLVGRRSRFAVHVAASYGNEEACAYVLAEWLDDTLRLRGDSRLHRAAERRRGSCEAIRRLFGRGRA
jgi:hypothetical protein